jgi:hypothetical protein
VFEDDESFELDGDAEAAGVVDVPGVVVVGAEVVGLGVGTVSTILFATTRTL